MIFKLSLGQKHLLVGQYLVSKHYFDHRTLSKKDSIASILLLIAKFFRTSFQNRALPEDKFGCSQLVYFIATLKRWFKMIYCISSNKRPRRLFNFGPSRCAVYYRAMLKRKRLFQSKSNYSHEILRFYNFLFQITINVTLTYSDI